MPALKSAKTGGCQVSSKLVWVTWQDLVSNINPHQMFTEILEVNWRVKYPCWVDKVCYIHRMDYYSAVKRDKLLTHTAAYVNPKGILVSE